MNSNFNSCYLVFYLPDAEGCLHSRCPVKTSKPVPKGQMAEVVAALDSVVLHAPIHVGDVVLQNVCGTGADIVTCRDMA